MKRRSKSPKIKSSPTKTLENIQDLPFHECFPITLSYKEGKNKKYCYFVCEDHLKKHLIRHKLKKGSFDVYETEPRNKINE